MTVLLWLGWLYIPRFYRRLHRWLNRRAHSESAVFHRLQQTCVRGDAHGCYARLLEWIAIAYPGSSLEQVAKNAGDGALEREANLLGSALYWGNPHHAEWNGRKLLSLLKAQRKSLHIRARKKNILADLNPGPEQGSISDSLQGEVGA